MRQRPKTSESPSGCLYLLNGWEEGHLGRQVTWEETAGISSWHEGEDGEMSLGFTETQ